MSLFRCMLILALLTLPLGACASVPLGSLIPLTRIDLMTTNLDALRAALRLPTSLRPRPAGVQMDVILVLEGQPAETVALALVETGEPADLATLPAPGPGGSLTYVYRLAPADIGRFDAIRKALAAHQAAHHSGSLSIGIATREFCSTGPVPAGPVPASTYLLTSENAGFVTLLEGFDLRGDPKLAGAFTTLSPC
ncbi:MAG: hypothetical protein HY834_19745 [Devosia nanyangense]|uniref:Uncharacterized protein n=1 Tax=Devosia nanyangense TaxID=1228055 RepID=A0A933L6N4_9HYPH|nr:hypothetical protein [Devosia nanyangense]